MHFLEVAQFLNAPDLVGRKVNAGQKVNAGHKVNAGRKLNGGHKVFGPRNNHIVLICIKLPMNPFLYGACPL